nr:G protein-coupled receptor [Proales similis]
MLSSAFSMLLVLAYVEDCGRLKAENLDAGSLDCNIKIQSKGHEHIDENQLKRFNQTVQKCQSTATYLIYERINANEESGESLADFNQIVFPLLARISDLKELDLFVLGGRGLSVDFEIPSFPSAPNIFFIPSVFDLRLLYNNGTEVRDFSTGSLVPSPFGKDQPVYLWFTRGTRYHTNTCPLIFNQAFISELQLLDLTDSTVKFNMLSFEPTNKTLNSTINQLQLDGYGVIFNSRIFPLVVFSETQSIYFNGMMNSFEAGTLKKTVVSLIVLAISRLRRFLHNNPGWLNEVNKRRTEKSLLIDIPEAEADGSNFVGEGQRGYITWTESKGSDAFDDSSFCIFYQIEQYSLNILFIGALIETKANESCSCLLFWIVTYFKAEAVECIDQVRLKKECDFDKMAQRCSTETVEPMNYRTIYDTILDLEFFKYLSDVWLVPVTSIVGIIANQLVIETFRKIKRSREYRRNKLVDKSRYMWEYTYYNSWFILFHSLIFACTPLTTCIELNGIFCFPFTMPDLFRPFYLFVEKFLGNSFRLAANMSSTLFVLYRYGLNTQKLSLFRKLKPKVLVAGIFPLSLSISVIVLFVNEKFSVESLSIYAIIYFSETDFSILHSAGFLQIAFILNTFLVTTFFTLLNMFIDLKLLFLVRAMNIERPKEETEKRITRMVILNGFFSFLFRLPEMISAILLFIFTLDQRIFSVCIVPDGRYHSVCPMLFSISHFLLTISYLENFVLLYFFNENFRKYFSLPCKDCFSFKKENN